ncbi:MAG TPA: carboxypeptidase regulatory-like domain-containing protein [Acidobacteriota bacterium]|jgi:hypothetical protein
MFNWYSFRISAVPLILGALAATASAQEFRATVTGRVTDPTGLAVPGVSVTARNLQSNETATAVTTDSGDYSIPFLKPGLYSITAEIPGFKTVKRDKLELSVSQTATIDIQLQVGEVIDAVVVTSDEPLMDDSKGDRGTVIDNQHVTELPLNARNPFMLSMLAAGVTYEGATIYQRPFDNGAIAEWSVNGGQVKNNEFLLDGAPNNAIAGGNNIAFVPPVDSVQEFKIMTNSYDAQYGRTAGGVINVSLKSGTKHLHGSVYEFARRNFLDANNLIANTRGIPAGRAPAPDGTLVKAEHFLDQYGIQLDGPVWIPKLYNGRNRTFFLFNFEGYREGSPNPAVRTVPMDAFLRGDFRELKTARGEQIVIYDPATGRDVSGQWIRDPFPNNIIPSQRIHVLAQKLIPFYPKPNVVTPGVDPWRNNYGDIPNIARDRFYNWVFKFDEVVSEKDRMFVRYGYNTRTEMRWTNGIHDGPGQAGQLPLIRTNYSGVVDWVHTFGRNRILNLRASANRFVEVEKAQVGIGFDATLLGFPKSLVDQLPVKIFPEIRATDYITTGRGNFDVEPSNFFTFQPNVAWTQRSHTIRYGLDMRLSQYSRQASGAGGMRLDFNRGFTQRQYNRGETLAGNSIASFLLGAIGGGFVDYNVFPIFMWKYYAPWFQDDWKVTKRLTLNFGVRWDLNTPIKERHRRQNYKFDPGVINPVAQLVDKTRFPELAQIRGGLLFTGVDGAPDTPWKLDKNNLQPRFGFAYRLGNDTVLRGGFGMYYMNPTGTGWNQGFSVRTNITNSIDGGRTPQTAFGDLFPNGIIVPQAQSAGLATFLGRDIGYANPNFDLPYVHNFSLGIQRKLPWNTVLEASYVGSRTYKGQATFGAINEPPLAFRNLCDIGQGGNRAYCDERLPNPFFRMPGFEGTTFFTSTTLSRFQLSRPFPHFEDIQESERNDRRIWYDSLQVTARKRFSHGLALNGTYTFSKSIDQPGFADNVARIIDRGPSSVHRPHRVTLSGVYNLPFGKGRRFLSNTNGVLDRVFGGWEMASAFIVQSGAPWTLPDNVLYLKDASLSDAERKRWISGIEYIQGARPCVEQLDTNTASPTFGQYRLLSYSVAYGCTDANFRIVETYQTNPTPTRAWGLRRVSARLFDINFAKNMRLTEKTRLQLRLEAFNVLNSPMYDRIDYQRTPTNSEFGSINKATVFQSNFPRQAQLAVKFIF